MKTGRCTLPKDIKMLAPVLLIAPDPAAALLADALRSGLPADIQVGAVSRDLLPILRHEDLGLILLDENLAAADSPTAEALYAAAGIVPVLEMNFAICNVDRVLREVKAALQRRKRNEEKARTAAASSLGNELNGSLTGLLLESQLALRHAGPDLSRALHHLIELAAEMRGQLRD